MASLADDLIGEIRLRRVGGRVPRNSGFGKTKGRRSGASYAGIWVTRPNQAARFSATLAATPSVNVTPSMTKGNWFAPFRRRHVLAAA